METDLMYIFNTINPSGLNKKTCQLCNCLNKLLKKIKSLFYFYSNYYSRQIQSTKKIRIVDIYSMVQIRYINESPLIEINGNGVKKGLKIFFNIFYIF
jgi:hypothetical protein